MNPARRWRAWLLIVGTVWLAGAPTGGRAAESDDRFAEEIRGLLEKGFDVSQYRLASVRLHYEAARHLSSKDPRADYAWVLVCLKRQSLDEAQKVLMRAVKQRGPASQPMWETAVRTLVQQGKHAQAVELLGQFAGRLSDGGAGGFEAVQRRQGAEWLGQMVSYLRLPGMCPAAVADQAAVWEAEIVLALDVELAPDYRQGKRLLAAAWQAGRDVRDVKAEVRAEQHETDDIAKAVRAEVLKDRLEERKEKHDQQVKTTQEQIQKTLLQFSDELNALAIAYGGLSAQYESDNAARQAVVSKSPGTNAALFRRMETAAKQMDLIEKRATMVLAARNRFLAQHQQFAQELAAEAERFEDWQKRAKLAQARSAHGNGPAKNAPPAETPAHALDRLVPLDLDAEKQRLLESLSAAAPADHE